MEISELKSENESYIKDNTDDPFEDELDDEQKYSEEIKMKKFNAGRYFIENFFKQLTMITIGTFKILNMCLDNNLGWGLLVIIFFLVNSAKAAPMGNEISEVNATEPEPFSYLNEGMKTVIYGATAAVTKNYILHLGNVEERIANDISDTCEAIATQNNICETDASSCPMVHLNKENYGSAIRKNFQTFSALGLACKLREEVLHQKPLICA